MSIISSDIQWFKSIQADSDGGTISSNQIADATLNNLFPDTTGDQSAAGNITYRKIFLKNNHGSLTWQSVVFWISSQVDSDESFSVALGTSSDTDPEAPSYTTPLDKGSGLSIGDLAPAASQGIWIKRTTPAGATAFPNATGILKAEGDSL